VVPDDVAGRVKVKVVYTVLEAQYQSALSAAVQAINKTNKTVCVVGQRAKAAEQQQPNSSRSSSRLSAALPVAIFSSWGKGSHATQRGPNVLLCAAYC